MGAEGWVRLVGGEVKVDNEEPGEGEGDEALVDVLHLLKDRRVWQRPQRYDGCCCIPGHEEDQPHDKPPLGAGANDPIGGEVAIEGVVAIARG